MDCVECLFRKVGVEEETVGEFSDMCECRGCNVISETNLFRSSVFIALMIGTGALVCFEAASLAE